MAFYRLKSTVRGCFNQKENPYLILLDFNFASLPFWTLSYRVLLCKDLQLNHNITVIEFYSALALSKDMKQT